MHDLKVVGRPAANCRVVGMVEYPHGTGEVCKMKDRIIRYLAERFGFSIFAIEANLPEGFRVNDYTVRGTGDPTQLIRGMYVLPWRSD